MASGSFLASSVVESSSLIEDSPFYSLGTISKESPRTLSLVPISLSSIVIRLYIDLNVFKVYNSLVFSSLAPKYYSK
jgi:hypothetical protein